MNSNSKHSRIAVLGGGSWGIAVAVHLHECGHQVNLWEFNPEDAEMLAVQRMHSTKLPGIVIPEAIIIDNDLSRSIEDVGVIALAVPSQSVRSVCRNIASNLNHKQLIVNLAKGIETGSLKRMSEIMVEELGVDYTDNVMTLSGPSHAEEVSRKIPTTVTVAGIDITNLEFIQKMFYSVDFRVYTNTDLIGVELAGSLKNIIAIAAGICDGLGFGDNTKGALLTRGLAEITRLGLEMGAKQETFAGLSGLGDLITTCLSKHSRNRFVGEQIGMGKSLDEVLAEMTMVAEGIKTAKAANQLADRHEIDMPITKEMYSILFEGKSPKVAVETLMSRLPKPEVRR
ncbi:MAG: NAD(P)H-dependent glycerol-3-phosphate dehydrogenase [candidate division Zixibacteria bacterium]|nr:NAD(P)H-dependent glycerol-3-phosphate dehydrogenase [candidate division Zixibacteria bacterium]